MTGTYLMSLLTGAFMLGLLTGYISTLIGMVIMRNAHRMIRVETITRNVRRQSEVQSDYVPEDRLVAALPRAASNKEHILR